MAVGFETTAVTGDHDRIALFVSYWLGSQANLLSSTGANVGGIFGTAVATMGMLMTAAYILAMDTFGPITDNAGGIAEIRTRRGRRARDHRRARRGGQHDQGADQGLRDRLGGAGGLPAVLGLHRRGQRDPGPAASTPASRARELLDLGQPRQRQRVHRRLARRRCWSSSSARWPSARSARRRRRSSKRCAASSARPGHHGLHPAPRLRARASTSRRAAACAR